MDKHTPGPLVAFEDDESIGIGTADGRDWVIARMEVYSTNDPDLNDGVQSANATLYAASPDLYRSLDEVIGLAEEAIEARRESDDDDDREMLDVYEDRLERARAAIARARGETPQ